MSDSYITVKQQASDEFVVNKSRFIGFAAPVETEQDALAFIRGIREDHRDASHNCYAYILGKNESIIRYSDDGEPSGTAGLPMIGVIRSQKIVNCAVVATRYFGGILLGTGGLTRAYSRTCKTAIDAARPVIMKPTNVYACSLPYSWWDRLNHSLSTVRDASLTDIVYTDQIHFTLSVTADKAEAIIESIRSLTGRSIVIGSPSASFVPWEIQA